MGPHGSDRQAAALHPAGSAGGGEGGGAEAVDGQADGPDRRLAECICGAEGRSTPDKRLLSEVARRTSKALLMMRAGKLVVVAHYERGTCFWRPAE